VILLVACRSSGSARDESDVWFEQTKKLSRQTVVNVKTEDGLERAKLIPTPVFRYSDQPRRIADASLWVWVHEGRLVAVQKIEANQRTKQPRWTYCFASFSSTPLDVRWPNRDRFETKGQEVRFQDVPRTPAPSEKPFVRLQQMKQIARRFTATIENLPDGSNAENMRLLPKPVFLYPQQPELPTLAVFGFASSGTNPDAYLVLQTEADGDSLKWTYGLRRMTTGGVTVKLDTDTVWETEWIDAIGGPVGQEGWIFFYEEREQD
jgi:hypothetical protein